MTNVFVKVSVKQDWPALPGIFAYMQHDQESPAYFRPKNSKGEWGYSVPRSLLEDKDKLKNWTGYPETVPMNPRDGVRMTEEIQWFIVAGFAWSKFRVDVYEYTRPDGRVVTVKEQFRTELNISQQEYLKEAFRKCFRDDTAFSNHSGIYNKKSGEWTGKSFIHGTGGPDLPRMWELSCGGSTHKVNSQFVTDDMETIELMTLKPTEYWKWKRYKFDDPQYRHFFFFATDTTPYAVGTRDTLTNTPPWKADEMDFLDGAHVALPFMNNNGKVTVARNRVEIIRDMREFRYPYIK